MSSKKKQVSSLLEEKLDCKTRKNRKQTCIGLKGLLVVHRIRVFIVLFSLKFFVQDVSSYILVESNKIFLYVFSSLGFASTKYGSLNSNTETIPQLYFAVPLLKDVAIFLPKHFSTIWSILL